MIDNGKTKPNIINGEIPYQGSHPHSDETGQPLMRSKDIFLKPNNSFYLL